MKMKVKRFLGLCMVAAFVASVGSLALAQEEVEVQPDRAVVPLSDPSKPAVIDASVNRGSITIKGYEGRDVQVEAAIREKVLSSGNLLAEQYASRNLYERAFAFSARAGDLLREQLEEKEKKERSTEGMKLITAARTGLLVEEDDNVVTVHTDSWRYSIDLIVQVPLSSSLKLRSANSADITIENVSGDIEINNSHGAIVVKNVSGTVVAHTESGDIDVIMNRVTPGKPLSFTNMNGDIDVTLPADLKADVKMKSQMGNVYSDFDVVLKPVTKSSGERANRNQRGTYRIAFDQSIHGMINGGGQEITFNTFNGDIFIRKRK